jgi:hypothetical protein
MFRKPPPKSALDISEQDLWSSLRVRRNCPAPDLLQSAIDHGLAGRRAKAYAALADYHRVSLADEWAHQQQIAAAAAPVSDAALQKLFNHEFNCWHKLVIKFDRVIDWHTPELGQCVSGFHYFGFFRPAVTEYLRSGDTACEAFILDIITQYKSYQSGANWTPDYQYMVFNQLGASSKFKSWLPAYLGLINHQALTTAAAESFIKHFLGFARAMKAGNREFIAHNIATHGCRCLLTIARLFPEFHESPGWDRLGTKRIYEQATKGFYKDGGHFERVWGYGSHTLQSVSEAYKVAQRHGGLGKMEQPMRRALRRAYQFYAKTLGPAPGYGQPTYGDSGQGSQLSVLEEGQPFFPKGTGVDLGIDRTQSYLMPQSGFMIMRNGDDTRSTYLNLSYGQYAGWHSHQDLLSLNLWAYNKVLLEEVGRFGPYANPLDTLFRAPDSHNLLTVDGMVYNCQGVKGEDVHWQSSDVADYFSATHWAYRYFCYGRTGEHQENSPNIEGCVRRTVLFVKDPGYAVVMDSVLSRLPLRPHRSAVTQNWHSPFGFRQLDATTAAAASGRTGCLLAFSRDDGLARLDTEAVVTEAEGSQWGAAYSRYALRARRWMPLAYTGTVGFTALLFPYTGKRPQIAIRARKSPEAHWWRAETFEIETPAGTDVLTLNPEGQTIKVGRRQTTRRAELKLAGRRGRFTVD